MYSSKLMLIFLLALTTACSLIEPSDANSKTTDAHLRLNDIWALESIQSEKLVLADGDRRPQLEIQLRDMRLMGNDGCNRFFASINYLDGKKITFGPIGGTRMFCHPMVLPDRFNQQLNQVSGYQLKNLILSFFDSEGKELLKFRKID
jgi:heat shock protein HslJ